MTDDNNDQPDYGPLTALIGVWRGGKGMDVAPEPDGVERNPYYETIVYTALADSISNAESQFCRQFTIGKSYNVNPTIRSFTMKAGTGCGSPQQKQSCNR